MLISAVLATLFMGSVVAQSDSEVVAVFLLGRHGDRTSRIQGSGIEGTSVLTTLGKNQIYDVASYFRSYYLEPSSPNYVQNFSDNLVLSQIYASAPYDSVVTFVLTVGMIMFLDCLLRHFYRDYILRQLQRLNRPSLM